MSSLLGLTACAMGVDRGVSDGSVDNERIDAAPGRVDSAPIPDAPIMIDAAVPSLGAVLLLGQELEESEWDVYRAALTAADVTFTEQIVDSTTFPTAVELADYNTVLWVTDFLVAPDDPECQLVVDWMAADARSLMLAGRDMLWDFNLNTDRPAELALYEATGTTYLGNAAGSAVTTAMGVASDPIGGDFVASPLTLSADSFSSGDYFDITSGTATAALLYGDDGAGNDQLGTGHGAVTHNISNDDRIVLVGFNIHNGIAVESQKTALLQKIFDFLAQ